MDNPYWGSFVTCSAKLVRFKYEGQRIWIWDKFRKPKTGIYIGNRNIRDGEMGSDIGNDFKVEKSFNVALVVFNPNENPVYVPFGSIRILSATTALGTMDFSPGLKTE